MKRKGPRASYGFAGRILVFGKMLCFNLELWAYIGITGVQALVAFGQRFVSIQLSLLGILVLNRNL